MYPNMRRNLVGHLSVEGTGIVVFSQLMGHGTTEDNTARHAPGLDVDEGTEIEASLEPCFGPKKGALVFLS